MSWVFHPYIKYTFNTRIQLSIDNKPRNTVIIKPLCISITTSSQDTYFPPLTETKNSPCR